jgi:CRP/FNR family transcriptional regulator, cyclic AMP receptor protein
MRLRASAKEQLIKSVPLFSHCSRAEIMALAGESDELTIPSGKELTRQGERGREFMVIVDGAAKVEKDGQLVNELGPSDFLGEIALLSDVPRTATVTTTTETTVLVLTDRAFKRVADKIPAVHESLVAALSARLQDDAL